MFQKKKLLKVETFTENQVLIFNAKLLLSPFESAVLFALNKFSKYANFLLNLPKNVEFVEYRALTIVNHSELMNYVIYFAQFKWQHKPNVGIYISPFHIL